MRARGAASSSRWQALFEQALAPERVTALAAEAKSGERDRKPTPPRFLAAPVSGRGLRGAADPGVRVDSSHRGGARVKRIGRA